MSPKSFENLLSSASITDLAVLFKAAQGAVSAIEAAGNQPRARSSTILSDWQNEVDQRLELIAEEIRSRVPANVEEKCIRTRCMAFYAAMTLSA